MEYIFTNFSKDRMISFMNAHPDSFTEMIELAIKNNHTLAPSAAWLLSNCTEKDDKRVLAYIPNIIQNIPRVRDGHQRDFINTLRKIEVGEEYHGKLLDNCVDIWCSVSKIPSVRISALKLILQIAYKHPDLSQEVLLMTQDQYIETLSPGIKRSVQRMITAFEKEMIDINL